MIDPARLAQVLHGLRLILRMDPAGLSFFEKSYAGFIRSFFPALILAPLHAIHIALTYGPTQARANQTSNDVTETISVIARDSYSTALSYTVIEALSYVLSWTLFPFVMIYVVRLLGCQRNYFAYVVPYNWLQLIFGLVILPLTILVDVQAINMTGAAFLNFIIVGTILAYGAFVARTALGLVTSTAIGIVILDIVLSLLSNTIIDRLH